MASEDKHSEAEGLSATEAYTLKEVMPKLQIPKQYIKQCAHVHVSTNRCGSRSMDLGSKWRGKWFCEAHEGKFEKCTECYAMLRAFQPKDGWS